jgi:hypothetical protein
MEGYNSDEKGNICKELLGTISNKVIYLSLISLGNKTQIKIQLIILFYVPKNGRRGIISTHCG